jgi:tetratricopeptide (TPR) repeat protein
VTRPSLLCLALLAACASTAAPPAPAAGDSARVAPALAEIDLAQASGKLGAVHERWAAASIAAPQDAVAAYLAAASLPDAETAWKALRDRADHHPREAWPHHGMARIYVLWDTWDQAAISSAKALQRAPGEPLVAVLQAEVQAHEGKRDEALQALRGLAAANPGLAEAHAALGRVLAAQDPAGARKELEAALQLQPSDLRSLSALARLCDSTKDAACSRRSLEELAKLNPADAPVQLRLAEARYAAGDPAGAAPAYAAGAVVEKGDEPQLRRAIECFHAANDAGSELAALARIDRLHPQDVPTLRRIAELKVATGASAESAYAALFEVAPDDPAANLSVARAAAAKGELYRAAVSYRRAAAGGLADAATELAGIQTRAHVSQPAIEGRSSVGTVAAKLLAVVGKLAVERRKDRPDLAGAVVAKVSVDAAGNAKEVTLLSDSTKDAVVAACVYLNLLDARYPAKAAEYKLEIPVR